MPYPWHDGDTLTADDLNAAIAAAANGLEGPQGDPGVMILTGYGPPTADAPDGTTYFDLSNGDVWTFGEPGGGGGAPDWVPADAVIHIDLVGGTPQGRAWSNGAEVAIDTLLGSDSENGFTYNAAKLVGDVGYQDEDGVGYPAFIGAAAAMMKAGSTLVLSAVIQDEDRIKLELGTSDFNHSVDLQVEQATTSLAQIVTYADGTTISSPLDEVINPSGIIKVSSNLKGVADAADCAFSINGRTAIAHSQPGAWGLPFDYVGFYVLGAPVLQSITVYDPLPDTTGLSELSEVP